MSWVYIISNASPIVYTTGFYTVDGLWSPDMDFDANGKEDAANRVHFLNGGAVMQDYFLKEGGLKMKEKVLALLQPCIVRDPTLQKLLKAVEEL